MTNSDIQKQTKVKKPEINHPNYRPQRSRS